MYIKDKDKAPHDSEDQDKGFAVHDKRRIGKEDPPGTDAPAPGGPDEQHPTPESPRTQTTTPPSDEADLPPAQDRTGPETGPRTGDERAYGPLTFTSFIMSLSTSALIYLGQVPDPVSGNTITDLTGARQTIDLISLLKEKTAGNLTPDETAFIETILYDLRMLFVKANT